MLRFTYRRHLWCSLVLYGGCIGALAAVILQVGLVFASGSPTLVVAFSSLIYLVFEIPIGMSGGIIAAGVTSVFLLPVSASDRPFWRGFATAAGGFAGGGIGMLWIRGFFGWEASPVLAFVGAGIVMSILFGTYSLRHRKQSEQQALELSL